MVKILNPFKMNDWEINKFIKVIFALQALLLILIGLKIVGLNIPVLRELVAIIYLLFVPGVLILRVLRLHKLSNIETLLYTVGLSIASLLFLGFFINLIYPLFGISKPLSLQYMVITITGFVVFLSVLSYFIDTDFSAPDFIDLNTGLIFPTFLFLCLIPFLAIFGTYLMNFYRINLILMILIIVIALIVILVGFNKIPKRLYPLIVFIISVSLLFHTSLISNYIWGWDINYEYYFANLVANNGYWNMQIPNNVNAMLSITILAPIFSKVSDITLVWVFKIVYPFIFSLVPLGLYYVFKNQTNEKIAFLSTFFFMSIFTFYTEMNQLCRQEIAEIFFILLIMLILNVDMNKIKKSFLLLIFAFSLVVSHYGLSYIFMLMLLILVPIIYYAKKPENRLFPKIKIKELNESTLPFMILFVGFVGFALIWYTHIASSSAFNTIVYIADHIISSIPTNFLDPDAAQGLNVLTVQVPSFLHKIAACLNYLFQLFIVIGVISSLRSRENFKQEYIFFALASLIILILSIILPYFASSLNMTRIYHITLFFLAPFAILGGINLFKIVYKLFKCSWTKKEFNNSLKIMAILISVLFLFFTGFMYEIASNDPTSFSLSKNVDYPIFNNQEVTSMNWLHDVKGNSLIYADAYRYVLPGGFESLNGTRRMSNVTDISKNAYLFLGTYNIKKGTSLILNKKKAVTSQGYMPYNSLIFNENKIYDNNGAIIYVS